MMPAAVAPSRNIPVVVVRLFIALLLGAQVGLVLVTSPGWLLAASLGMLLGALAVSLLVDVPARQALFSSGRRAPAIKMLVIFVVSLLPVLFAFTTGEPEHALEAVVLELPLLVALAIGRTSVPMTMGTSIFAWAGFGGLAFLGAWYAVANQDGGDTASFQFTFALVFIIPGFGLSLFGGMLGHLLNRWVFRP